MEFVLSHEHAIARSPGVWEQYPHTVDRGAIREKIVHEFRQAREHGVSTIVDVTTLDLGREVSLVESAAQSTGMRVVHATGIWLDIPRFMLRESPEGVDEVAALFIQDIRVGIAGRSIKAGVIKLASDATKLDDGGQLSLHYAQVFRAGARAAKATGVAITTHTDGKRQTGMSQAAIFEDEGLDPSRVAIGHSTLADLSYLLELLARGYYLSMDTFAYLRGESLQEAIDRIAELCRQGWAHRLMLGHDHCCYNDRGGGVATPELSRWCRIPLEVAPALVLAGLPDEQIATVCGGGAREFFRL